MTVTLFYGLHFAAQFIFLVLCLQISGRILQIDFGLLRPALLKALVLTVILAAFWFFVAPYVLSWMARGVILGVISWLSLTFLFGLDQTEVWLLTPIVAAGSWLVLIIINVAILDLFATQ